MAARIISFDRAYEILRPGADHLIRRMKVELLIARGRVPLTPPVPPADCTGEAFLAVVWEDKCTWLT